ncbi:MAG: hypothetical protein ACK56I_17615, partial [bacterium]
FLVHVQTKDAVGRQSGQRHAHDHDVAVLLETHGAVHPAAAHRLHPRHRARIGRAEDAVGDVGVYFAVAARGAAGERDRAQCKQGKPDMGHSRLQSIGH